MNGNKRPLPVTILAWVYVGVGTVGFVYHFNEIRTSTEFRYEDVWVELVRLLAIIGGVFMLRGHNWARWLALAWIAFHVILSAFRSLGEFALHALFCAAIVWLLFLPQVRRYFHPVMSEPI